jgi:hypothetical protein
MRSLIYLQFTVYSLMFSIGQAQDTIFVPQDYTGIQLAIDAATNGDVILVDDGTYVENINFSGKAITVASYYVMDGDTNHIHNTTIDGSQPADPDNGSVVTMNSGEDTTSVLCGFTITGGTGTLFQTGDIRSGGGILCYNAGATIRYNIITGNGVTGTDAYGGGVAMSSDGSEFWVVLEWNNIQNNSVHATGTGTENIGTGGGIHNEVIALLNDNVINGNSVEAYQAQGGGVSSIPAFFSSAIFLEGNIINNNSLSGTYCWGGGMASAQTSVKLMNNQFKENYLEGVRAWGGGASLRYNTGSTLITENEISDNELYISDFCVAGGLMVTYASGPVNIKNNVISSNTGTGTSYGGGLTFNNVNGVDIIVAGNIISDNQVPGAGGGIYTGAGMVRFVNNMVIDNTAGQAGGGMYMTVTGKSNEPHNIWGGPLYEEKTCTGSSDAVEITFINNTFSGNSAGNIGGAIRCNYTTEKCFIMNTIFWENEATVTGNDIYYTSSDTVHVFYSDIDPENISGTWAGDGNINENPGFCDTICHIDENSPCVDIGMDSLEFNGTWYYAPDRDFEGTPRPYGAGGFDIGADECDIFTAISKPVALTQNSKFNIQIYPNPTIGISHFAIHISQYQYVACKIYDLRGREIAMVMDEKLPEGEHVVRYDMSGLPEGMYLVRLTSGEEVATEKVLLVQ